MGNGESKVPSARYVRWERVSAQSRSAGRSLGIATIGRMIYLFGGHEQDTDKNTLQIFDSENLEFLDNLKIVGEAPPPRSFHSFTAVGTNIYVFGGHSSVSNELNDMYIFDTLKREWKEVEYNGEAPVGRYEHTACAIKNKIYIFGGGNSSGWLNELIVYDVITNQWHRPHIGGRRPQKRLSHSASVIGNSMVIFGGYDPTQSRLNDFHILNVSEQGALTWTQPVVQGVLPTPRAGHSSVAVDRSLFLFGGFDGQRRTNMNDIYVCDIRHLYCQKPIVRGNDIPVARSYPSATSVGRRLFLFYGFDGRSELSDVWYLEMDYVGDSTEPIVIPPSALEQDYAKMVNCKDFSDVQFELDDGTTIYGHKIILTHRSEHFRSMFQHGMRETTMSSIPLHEVSSDMLLLLFTYIYSGTIELRPDTVAELLKVADQFGEDRLKLQCQQFIEKIISHQSVCQCFELADRHSASHLRKACLNYILVNFEFIENLPTFKELPEHLKNEIFTIIERNLRLKGTSPP